MKFIRREQANAGTGGGFYLVGTLCSLAADYMPSSLMVQRFTTT